LMSSVTFISAIFIAFLPVILESEENMSGRGGWFRLFLGDQKSKICEAAVS